MPFAIPDEIHARVNGALAEGFPLSFMAVSEAGEPVVSFRGSTQTFGDDALAIWVRAEPSSTLEAIAANPGVAVVYTNMPARKFWIFRGRARITTDQADRDAIWEGQHPLEKQRDPEHNGIAVIIDLDSIQGSGINLKRD